MNVIEERDELVIPSQHYPSDAVGDSQGLNDDVGVDDDLHDCDGGGSDDDDDDFHTVEE